MGQFIDLTGRIYGHLVVIEAVEKSPKGGRLWLCQCHCGNQTTASSGVLNSGDKRTCGCARGHKLVGRRVGMTTVIAKHGLDKRGAVVWLCRCDCGNERLSTSAQINSMNIRLCTCRRDIDGRTAPKSHDLTGRQFGRLTVIEQVPTDKKQAKWICACSCGQRTVVVASYLVKGATKSCGCLRTETKQPSLVGEVFGRYAVLKQIETGGQLRDRWLCRCLCGNENVVHGKPLRNGNTKSCGCLKIDRCRENAIDIQGRVYGRLTVLERMPSQPGSKNGVQWLCQCSCEKQVLTFASRLQREGVVSCGCAKINRDATLTSEKSKVRGRVNGQRYRARAAETGGTFAAEDVANRYRWQRGRCALPHCRRRLHDIFGVDHIIPLSSRRRNGVQIKDLNDRRNTQLVCLSCNSSKSDKDPMNYNRQNGFLL